MHNNIMAAGSRDHLPMLAPGQYPQWRSRFLRYVDTRPNGKALRKCILSGPYKPTTVLVQAVEATDNSPAVAKHTTFKTPSNMSPENKAHFLAEKEAIHLILTGIGDDIYSTVDACQIAQEIWEAIERLQQGEFLNIQDVKTNLFWEFGKFTSHDGESMESYYMRFYMLMNEMIRNNLIVTTMHVNVQFLQQLQLEWSRNANPLALVATTQASQDLFYESSRSHRSSAPSPKPSIPSRSHTSTRHKGYMAKIQEVPTADSGTDSEPVEQWKGMIVISLLIHPICVRMIFRMNKNDADSDDERVALANLIANLKLDVDENKMIQKQLKKANTTLAQELKKCKAILAKTSKSLGESISVRDSCPVALQTKQAEFEKYKVFNDHTIDYDKLKRKLNDALGLIAHKDTVIREGLKTKSYELSMVNEKHDELMKQSLKQKMKVIMDLKLREEHDIEKMLSMEKKLKFLNEIVYKRSQSIQTIHMMAPKVSTYNGRPTFANPRYLKQDQSEIPCLYAYPYDQNSHANRLIPDGEETLALERES
nr:hypothetical protein [Tanacetum cinerariifolium]